MNAVPKAGIFVTEIDLNEVEQAYEVRVNLESFAAKPAAERNTPQHLGELKRLLNKMKKLLEKPDDIKKLDIDKAFHELVWRSSHNLIMEDTLKRLQTIYARLWTTAMAIYATDREAVELLGKMHRAFETRDGDTAAELMKAHILSSIERVKSRLL